MTTTTARYQLRYRDALLRPVADWMPLLTVDDVDTARRYAARHHPDDVVIAMRHTGARVPPVEPAKPHACGIRCTGAGLGTVCECECAGLHHATLHIAPELRPGYRPSAADPFARLPQLDDEAF